MTDWNDPAVLTKDYLAFVKLIHTLGGVYIWEFVSNLDFEWDIYKGRRSYRWSLWKSSDGGGVQLYIGCRLTALAAVIAMFVGFDVTSKINCTGQAVSTFLFGYLAFICASALIVLRVGAIWEWNRLVVVIACLAWSANAAFGIRSAVISRAAWNVAGNTCIVLHTERSKDNILTTLATDSVLLVLMLVGLMRWHRAGLNGGIFGLLLNQGLLWVLVVTLAEVPSTVFILLNFNAPWNLMFQVPELIIMAIGASRIYRGLLDYSSIDDLQSRRRVPASPARDSAVPPTPRQPGHHSAVVFLAQAESGATDMSNFDEDHAKRGPIHIDEEMGLQRSKIERASSRSSSAAP
ncbi:hypothetical protein FA95DRAFT_1607338 [Auriscalpium vulgare]|uniref:Uncharacterized protein n=1 Tax=Auriscalpium vulgare TaxID=40419 RepID=A0ACB8RNZ4_9AGAM|nr:hypothetical protein FA95DRAFT_1607338 [Auriscalpium vulgare]